MNRIFLISLLCMQMVVFSSSAFAERKSIPEMVKNHEQQIQQLLRDLDSLKKQQASTPSTVNEEIAVPLDIMFFPPEGLENCSVSKSIIHLGLKIYEPFDEIIIEKDVKKKLLRYDITVNYNCSETPWPVKCVGAGSLILGNIKTYATKEKRLSRKLCVASLVPLKK